MDLYLHIGTEKTGTTTIQEFLKRNRERLFAKGVQYPQLPGPPNQISVSTAALEEVHPSVEQIFDLHSSNDLEQFRRKMSAALSRAFSGKSCKMAILSNEHCSSRLQLQAEVQSLHDMLRPLFDRIFIVVYLRRQDEFLLSTYSTAVKTGLRHPLALPKRVARRDRRYDHSILLSRWASVFGRDAIICRKFERSTLKNGDIIDDFLQTIGLENDPDFERPPNQNESLDAESLEFLRLMNAHIGARGPLRYDMWQALAKIGKGPLLTLPAETLAEFMGELRDTNRQVAEEYFGGARQDSDDPLFAPLKFSRPRVERSDLTLSDAIWIMARVWAYTNGDVEGRGLTEPPSGEPVRQRRKARKLRTAPSDADREALKKERMEKRALKRALKRTRTETPSVS